MICSMANSLIDVEYNYKKICEKISNTAIKCGKSIDDITLLAATKTVDAATINHAISLGLTHIGENRVQELLSKYDDYNLDTCTLQFIGLPSDGRGGDAIHPHPPPAAGAGRHLPPRGRQDFFVFLVIQKLICNSMFLALGERGTYLTTCLPLGEGGTP